MSKKRLFLFLAFFIIIIGCAPKNYINVEEAAKINHDANEVITVQPQATEKQELGGLCSGEDECKDFCSRNRGKCESYCRGKKIEICRIIFPPDEDNPRNYRPVTGCKGKGPVEFTSPPMLVEDIGMIEPIGLMIGDHVTPIDHGYYTSKVWKPGSSREDPSKFADILVPASGTVTQVQSMPAVYSSSSIGDYRIVIHHTCTFYTIYIHINQLSEKLKSIADTSNHAEVEAGELIGRAPGFDFSVHNDEITLKGFIVPENYIFESWKIHTVDMFEHFAEPVRSQLLDKNIRQKEPRGGKIDYDIDGRLVGNWFAENTNGYMGIAKYPGDYGYWNTHLAFAYDGLDPSLIVVSMGNFNGEAMQFAVKGNLPDPANVSAANGLVKYELVAWQYITEDGKDWDRENFAKIANVKRFDDQVAGLALVQMLEDRKIKFEAFPGKKAAEVSGFTDKARIYER